MGAAGSRADRTPPPASRPNGALPGRHFEKNHAQGEKVGACVERLSERLLGRHVTDLLNNLNVAGHFRHLRHGVGVPGWHGREKRRYAEIEDLDAIVVRNHDVFWLEVTMQDSRGMSTCKALGDLRRERQRSRQRQRARARRSSRRLRPSTSSIVMKI